jgi:hypothetical protein
MKMLKKSKMMLLGMISLLFLSVSWKAEARPNDYVSFQVFYDNLAPYGDWVYDNEYGYVWIPDVGPNFHPYSTNGHWVMTEYGNTWVSNYDWGWAPFHYGRWYYSNRYGWAWVPDYEWGPAWVTWRSGGGYYGWAPLGPRMSVSVSLSLPEFHWVFVSHKRIHHPRVHKYYVPSRNRVKIINRTTIINHVYVVNNKNYYSGPARREIERAIGRKVDVREIRSANAPVRSSVNNRVVNIYRPSVDQATRNAAKPSRVVAPEAVVRGGHGRTPQAIERKGEGNRVVLESRKAAEQGERAAAQGRREGNQGERTAVQGQRQASASERQDASKALKAQKEVKKESKESRKVSDARKVESKATSKREVAPKRETAPKKEVVPKKEAKNSNVRSQGSSTRSSRN